MPWNSANEVGCGVGDDRGEYSESGEIERTLEEDAEPTKLEHVARRAVEPVAHAKARKLHSADEQPHPFPRAASGVCTIKTCS